MFEILYVGYRDKSHSSAGGYDNIINNSGVDSLMGENVPFGFIPVSQRGKILNVLALDLLSRLLRFKYDIVHYFYGDTMLLPFLKMRKHKVVATIHLDIDDDRRNKKFFIRSLRSLDGIVVLSSNQKRILKEQYNLDSEFIPHGFNKPKYQKMDTAVNHSLVNVCVLGQNYRDYETLNTIIEYCSENRQDICFHLIGQPKYIKDRFSQFDNVVVYQYIPDDMYFSIISDCDYNFLPVTFATANNALLEAGFLGVTSILPQLPGIEDYSAPFPFNIYYSNTESLIKIFTSLGKNTKSDELVSFCNENFAWEHIYKKLEDYYKTLYQ